MHARNPKLTFEDALPHWAPDRAFAQIVNAGSISIPPVEIFLNKVMAQAAAKIDDAGLRRDVAVFIAQEGNHYRQHRMFNKAMTARYPGLAALEDELTADYERMLKTGSLRANAAYCEGFESLGLIQVEFFFEQVDDLLEGADPRLVRLWRWHLAEEYEHRTVCYDVLRALGGGYATRLLGFLKAVRHLGGMGDRISRHLIAADAEALPAEERRKLARLEKAYRRRLLWFSIPRLLAVLSPTYDPRRKRAPRGSEALLREIAPVLAAG